ncbi:alpha/beta hydrolase [Alcanivorax sp. N3-2A]|nr:alpha/beta hydrolase [Alcanivorax sp. N3-2A]|tara:strand:- start:30778 stop:31587 length:810 start_codon:yes stop_codon:yes gene_type:complete
MAGTTWILLRGLVREQAHWDDFPERFAHALGSGHRIVCLDLPGNGQLHAQTSPARVDAMVDAARQQVRERGIRGPLRLVALSLGGMVAVQWLCNHPDEIEAVALINSSAARFSPFWKRLRPMNYASIVFQGLLGRDRLRRERMILRISTNLLNPEQRERLAERFTEVDRLRPVGAANTVRQLWAALRFRAPVALPPAVPVLVINGAGDRLVHPDCSRDLARHWQQPLLAHPDGGHDLSLDAPEWLARTLLRWWTEQGEMSPVDGSKRLA